MAPLVSVVVPVFNGMSHLPQTVESILRQSHTDLDIVLVDGGSTDGSREWIANVSDARVRVELMPHGTTAADNWTAASRAARGNFVKLLCQDDILHPQAIAHQVEDLLLHADALFAVAQRDIVDANGRMLYPRRGCAGLPAGLVEGDQAVRASYLHGTNVFGEPLVILFRREPLEAALSWNDERPFILDLELYTRVLAKGPIVVRRESIGAFRVSSSSWSTRLVRSQTDQLRSWQHDVARTMTPPPNTWQRARAEWAVREQSMLRQLAYRVLRLRGTFHSPMHSKLPS